MEEQILKVLEQAGQLISLFAVAVIVFGFVLASVRYGIGFRKLKSEKNFTQFKVDLGKTLMLGLEILVLSDVIETITIAPTYKSLAGLAFLVIVRTFVSWTLGLDVEGRWPWQAEKEETNV
ncbi:MAG: DUF1622 domain-containing protein [Eudoraea sp.]|uniref:DUF1622 domain-containing protein n=1 Tax=Eudoraea sp. TaxID=1979955 RepID=UPI00326459AD